MLQAAIIAGRLIQFSCAMLLLGAPLFFLYGLPSEGPAAARTWEWPRPMLFGVAGGLGLGAIISLCAQTAVMTGSPADSISLAAVAGVVTSVQFGLVTAVRFGMAMLVGLVVATVKPSRGLWLVASGVGVMIVGSFAWSGHAAADDGQAGWTHLASDVLHLISASVWLGALAVLSILVLGSGKAATHEARLTVHNALKGFSGIGSGVVTVLLATGLVNSWFLVGPSHMAQITHSPYGLALLAKVALFAAMLGMAASNRFHLVPRLGDTLGAAVSASDPLQALRLNLLAETLAGILVLVVVSLLGAFEPPTGL